MRGQSKLRFINIYIWDQPWFIELSEKEKLSYIYMHTKCSDIGIYLHSEKAMMNHLGYKFTIPEILKSLNKKRETVVDLGSDTLLFQWFVNEHTKRGSKIKPISNPDLGKVREAIDSDVLDLLINNGTFSSECKYFEFGISESIIENTTYSARQKKGNEHSSYEEMILKVKNYINHKDYISKPFERYIEGLSKPIQNVLIKKPSNNETKNLTIHQNQSILSEIADGLKFECADFLIEEEVKKEMESLSSFVKNIDDWMLEKKEEYQNGAQGENTWDSFLEFISKEKDELSRLNTNTTKIG